MISRLLLFGSKIFCVYFLFAFVLPALFPTLSIYRSKVVVILFNKPQSQLPQCISSTVEFKRTQKLFSHLSKNQIHFIEMDCAENPMRCQGFSVYSVPQMTAYVVKPHLSKIMQNKFKKPNITTILNQNASTPQKFIQYFTLFGQLFISYAWIILQTIIPYLHSEFRFSNRQKISISFQYSDEAAVFINQLSQGEIKYNTKKFALTPKVSPIDFSYMVFAREKCGIATLFDTIVPTQTRDLYDYMLTPQFRKSMPNFQNIEAVLIDAQRYKAQILRTYNITNFPQMVIEHNSSITMISFSSTFDEMLQTIIRECK